MFSFVTLSNELLRKRDRVGPVVTSLLKAIIKGTNNNFNYSLRAKKARELFSQNCSLIGELDVFFLAFYFQKTKNSHKGIVRAARQSLSLQPTRTSILEVKSNDKNESITKDKAKEEICTKGKRDR